MKPLGLHVQDYLALRRRLGFKLRNTEQLLRQFARFAKENGTSRVTTRLVVRWATRRPNSQAVTLAARYRTARLFALYLSGLDSRVEVPPAGLLPCRKDRRAPYIYSDREVVCLMREAASLPSPKGLRGPTLSTLIGLLAVTGLRIGEAIRLGRDDVDLPHAMLTIDHAKGYRTRLVPIHASTCVPDSERAGPSGGPVELIGDSSTQSTLWRSDAADHKDADLDANHCWESRAPGWRNVQSAAHICKGRPKGPTKKWLAKG